MVSYFNEVDLVAGQATHKPRPTYVDWRQAHLPSVDFPNRGYRPMLESALTTIPIPDHWINVKESAPSQKGNREIKHVQGVDMQALKTQRATSREAFAGLINFLDSILAAAISLTQRLGFITAMPQTDPIHEMVYGINKMVTQH